MHGGMHVKPLDGGADLAAMGRLCREHAFRHHVEIGIRLDDDGCLAAEFQRGLGDVDLAVVQNRLTGGDAAGQGDHADLASGRHHLGHFVAHGHDADEACGRSASLIASAKTKAEVGVLLLGRTTTALPVIRAGAILRTSV